MARYQIVHRTNYRYRFPVAVSHHTARLKPLVEPTQSCEDFNLEIDPSSVDLIERSDYFGNTIHMFSVQESHESLTVDSTSEVYVTKKADDLAQFETNCQDVAAAFADLTRKDVVDARQFVYGTEYTQPTAEAKAFGQRFISDQTPLGKAVADMLDSFAEEFEFDPSATEISTPVDDVLKSRRGVCQDFAHLMISSLRSCGLAARYVSGYILTEPPVGEERLEGADASHAWLSVFLPSHGWIDVDPTNRMACGDKHIKVAYGRDYFDVSMLKGAVTGGGEQKLTVEVTVRPIE